MCIELLEQDLLIIRDHTTTINLISCIICLIYAYALASLSDLMALFATGKEESLQRSAGKAIG